MGELAAMRPILEVALPLAFCGVLAACLTLLAIGMWPAEIDLTETLFCDEVESESEQNA